jgi:hypothetical protein
MENIQQDIIKAKNTLRNQFNYKKSFIQSCSNINREVESILEMQAKEIPIIP